MQEDLGLKLPSPDIPLHEIDHPLIARSQQRADVAPTEKIASIDDVVLLKCKPGGSRWRGAVWEEQNAGFSWLVAAGNRTAGARDDFYRQLCDRCKRKRTALNQAGLELAPGKRTYSKHLLPAKDDQLRLDVERSYQRLQEARASIPKLINEARENAGTPVRGEVFGTAVEAFVYRAVGSYDELYLGLRVVGSAPDGVHYAILRLAVPEAEAGDWEPIEAKHRSGEPGEVFYFTLLEVPKLNG
ncbi:hypothetical protein ACIQJ8_04680 [Streptomyces globisporus]|uniref:hypothetical protein n=1 Tax=Streptomyces griseus group TaxID=629295 RepID=UPI002E2FAC62|nr:hypothetical protein [Streptomyces microflavus]